MAKYLFFIILFIFFFQANCISQKDILIQGKVFDRNNIPIELVNVSVKGTSTGSQTNTKGIFKFTVKHAEQLKLSFSHLSYQTKDTLIKWSNNSSLNLQIILYKKDRKIEEIKVIDERSEKEGLTRINPKLLNNLPDISGNKIQSFIKTLPGVASINEMSAAYTVRGGNFDENLIYINNIEILKPVLLQTGKQEGLDMINSDLVGSVYFSPGGFSAKYGDKMASVLDITYKNPRTFKTSVSISMLGGNAHTEGCSKTGRLSFLAGMRYKNSQYLFSGLETSGEYKPNFLDFQSLFTYKLNSKFSIDFLAYAARNNYLFFPKDQTTSFGTVTQAVNLFIDFQGKENDRYNALLGSVKLNYNLNFKTKMFLEFASYYDHEFLKFDILARYSLNQLDKRIGSSTLGDSILNLGIGSYINHARNYFDATILTYNYSGKFQENNHLLQWGVKYRKELVNSDINEWTMIDSAGFSIPYNNQSIELSESFKTKIYLNNNRITSFILMRSDFHKWNINYGLRYQYWDFNKASFFSPRVSSGFYPDYRHKLYLRFSSGFYFQTLFYNELTDRSGTLYTNIKTPRSVHFAISADYDFLMLQRNFHLKTEIYYKLLDRFIPYSIDNIRVFYYPDKEASGYAGGIDLRLNGEFVKGVESWLSLSFMKSGMKIKGDTIGWQALPNDHPVNISLFFQDYVPGYKRYSLYLMMTYLSGLPFGSPNNNTYYAPLRMPDYKRVDLGFRISLKDAETNFSAKFLRKFSHTYLSLEVFNLLGINNIISYNWITVVPNTANANASINGKYAVPNRLSSRMLNIKINFGF